MSTNNFSAAKQYISRAKMINTREKKAYDEDIQQVLGEFEDAGRKLLDDADQVASSGDSATAKKSYAEISQNFSIVPVGKEAAGKLQALQCPPPKK